MTLKPHRNLIVTRPGSVLFHELKQSLLPAIRTPLRTTLQNGGTHPAHQLVAIKAFLPLQPADVFFAADIANNTPPPTNKRFKRTANVLRRSHCDTTCATSFWPL